MLIPSAEYFHSCPRKVTYDVHTQAMKQDWYMLYTTALIFRLFASGTLNYKSIFDVKVRVPLKRSILPDSKGESLLSKMRILYKRSSTIKW